MKIALISILLFTAFNSKAQNDYTIEYTMLTGVKVDSNDSVTYEYKRSGCLYIYSDSLSFFTNHPIECKKIRLKSAESHTGILRFLKTDSTYDNMSTPFKKHYFASRPKNYYINTETWDIFNDTLNILGYTCYKAVNDDGVVAWFTYAIPVKAGPTYYYGLPGVILQVNNYDKRKEIISAKSISKKSTPIVFPEKYAFISTDVCNAIHKGEIPKNDIVRYSWQRRF